MPAQIGFSVEAQKPGILKWFNVGSGAQEVTVYDRIFQVHNATLPTERVRSVGDFGPQTQMGHGADYPFERFLDGRETSFTAVKYGKAFGINEEAIDDDQYGVVKRSSEKLGRSRRVTKEYVAAAVFNNGFATALADGKVLFASDHPLLGGGSDSNLLATPGDPSYSTWFSMMTLIQIQKDEAGNPLSYMDSDFQYIVHPNYYAIAKQAVESTSAPYLGSGTSVQNANPGVTSPYKGRATVVPWAYLTDANASFLSAGPQKVELHFFVRKDPASPKVYMDETNDTIISKHAQRIVAGAADWRGLVGTPGAS